jgi:hypothetical protein
MALVDDAEGGFVRVASLEGRALAFSLSLLVVVLVVRPNRRVFDVDGGPVKKGFQK